MPARSDGFDQVKGGDQIADLEAMSTGPINNLSSYVKSLVSSALQGTGLTTNSANRNPATTGVSSVAQSDSQQLSPFAQMMSELQQLQQSDPSKYSQVTQQIATNLQNAAQTATSQGNTFAASQLNRLSNDFTQASQSGQLPNIQDLAQAVGAGGHHHGHHHHVQASSSDADGGSSSGSSSSTLSQLLSAFQANSTQSDALNPTSIIMNTLASAGISGSNG
jgi:hypothetical protein